MKYIDTTSEALSSVGVLIPSMDGIPMSPLEVSTGIPLVISAPIEGRVTNRHHAYFLEKRYTAAKIPLQALRLSRLQEVSADEHLVFHQTFVGTLAPETEERQYAGVILSLAGYVTQCGVKVQGNQVSIGELTPAERIALRRPGIIMTQPDLSEQRFMRRNEDKPFPGDGTESKIVKYLMGHALSKEMEDVKESTIEEFLSISEQESLQNDVLRQRRYRLGLRLANKAIGIAVDPVNEDFQLARRNNYLRQNVPVTPWHLVKQQIRNREFEYFGKLERNLRMQYGQEAA